MSKKILLVLILAIHLPKMLFSQTENSDLKLYLPFCNDARDYSGNANNGTDVTAELTSDKSGTANNAYSFVETGHHIDVPSDPTLKFQNNITVSCWVYFNSLRSDFYGQSTILSAGPYIFELQVEMLNLAIELNGASGTFYGGTIFQPNRWYFVSCTYDYNSSPNLKLYVNGNLDGTGAWPLQLNDFVDGIRVGNRVKIQTGEPFKGKIDEVRVYNRTLSEAEIKNLYNLPLSRTSPKPKGIDLISCQEGIFALKATGGTHYKWYDKAVGGDLLSVNDSFSTPYLTKTDTFYVSNTDFRCESIRDTVIVEILPSIKILGPDIFSCKSSATLSSNIIGESYKWTLPDNSVKYGREIYITQNGNYILELVKGQCTYSDTINVSLNNLTYPSIKVFVNNIEIFEDTILLFNTVSVRLETSINGKNYSWLVGGQEFSTSQAELELDKEGDYEIFLTQENEENCVTNAKRKIYFRKIFIPNVFTPNYDNYNDYFKIRSLEFVDNPKLTVFNRWGQNVFSDSNYRNNWAGDNLSAATYYFTLNFNYLKQHYFYKGIITILK
jgi:gliding motility-associated-like protein